MLKRFRVPGRLALKLKEHGVSVAAVLRKAGLPRDLFEQTRVLVSTEELFALWNSGSELTTWTAFQSAKSSSVETRTRVCSNRSWGSPALRSTAATDTPWSFNLRARRPGTRKRFSMTQSSSE